MNRGFVGVVLAGVCLGVPSAGRAQPMGEFRWQLQPFCNVVTVHVSRQGDTFTVAGHDDQCGAPQRAPLVGVATLNPDGSVGLGLHVVTVPGGRALSIDARVDAASGHGAWVDGAGNSGTFALGARTGGAPRPAPTIPAGAIAPGSISAAQLAPGVIGAVAQARVGGLCTNGQAMRGINPDGSVACTNAMTTVDDPTHDVGQYSSLAIGADGLPIVSYLDATTTSLVVLHCGDSACVSGNRTTGVTPPDISWGAHSSLAIGSDGLPVVAFADYESYQLRILHCGTVDCDRGNVTTAASGPGKNAGEYTAIAIGADGLPIISHLLGKAGLRMTHCGNVTCTAGNVSTTVTSPGLTAGHYSSIAIGADGRPIVSHADLNRDVLVVTHCADAACTSGATTRVDTLAQPHGYYSSLAIGPDRLPIVAHHVKGRRGALRVTKCGTPTCQ